MIFHLSRLNTTAGSERTKKSLFRTKRYVLRSYVNHPPPPPRSRRELKKHAKRYTSGRRNGRLFVPIQKSFLIAAWESGFDGLAWKRERPRARGRGVVFYNLCRSRARGKVSRRRLHAAAYKYCAKRVEFDMVPPGKSGEQITSWSRWMVGRYLYNTIRIGAISERCEKKKKKVPIIIIIIRLYAYSLCIVCHRVLHRRESHFISNDRNTYIIINITCISTYVICVHAVTRQCKHIIINCEVLLYYYCCVDCTL